MEYDPNDENHAEIMAWLVAEDAAIFAGFDESGEPIYNFDMDILEEIAPEIYAQMQQDIDEILVDLYKKDLVEITYDEDLNALIFISDEGKAILESAGFDLDDSEEE